LRHLRLISTILITLLLMSSCSNAEDGFGIDQSEAIEIARTQDNSNDLTWNVIYEDDKIIQLDKGTESYNIWTATTTYPYGNKLIVQIDASTGEILSVLEVEAEKM
jgi:hypothetical protein